MLEDTRIKEAEANVKNYLDSGMLKKIANPDIIVKNVLIRDSKESLKVAEILFKNDYSDLWTIVCSYYSMYYIANAVLYSKGYKVGDKITHKVTADALIVYVRKQLKNFLIDEYEEAKEDALEIAGLKADEIIRSFDYERVKRSRIQYDTGEEAKKSKAETSFKRAKEFVFEMEKLLPKDRRGESL